MSAQRQPEAQPSEPPSASARGRSVSAAAWPLLGALGFAAYAFFPQRFPEQTGMSIGLLVAAEIPALFVGLAHAAALAEPTVRGRLKTFFVWIGTLALVFGLWGVTEVDFLVVAPMLFWVLIPYVIELCSHHDDPSLASRQAEAVLEDRLHLIALTPFLAIGGVLLAIATLVLLALLSIALGLDLVGGLTGWMDQTGPSLFALFGSAYLLLVAASSAHVHRRDFLRHRKSLLDRPWINRLTAPSKR